MTNSTELPQILNESSISTTPISPLQGIPVPQVAESVDIQTKYVDLGNGLGLATYNRGPPSLSSDSTENYTEDEICGPSSKGDQSNRSTMNDINDYMARLIHSNSTTSNTTEKFSGNQSTVHDHNASSHSDTTEENSNLMDLGNGLALNAYKRGPPSILTSSSDEEDGDEASDDMNEFQDLVRMKERMAQFAQSYIDKKCDLVSETPSCVLSTSFSVLAHPNENDNESLQSSEENSTKHSVNDNDDLK